VPTAASSRALPAAVVEALLSDQGGQPQALGALVIREARKSPEVPADLPLPPSTVHRLLARHGLMDKPKEEPGERDRRRFAFAQAGELWMSDVMHGPSVVVGGAPSARAYLIAFIDDATRVIPHAAFALSENTATFLPVLQQAIEKRGLPQRLYVDNGANYRSQQLALVCAKLGIALIHARPYRPQGKGKIERWFKTVRAQLLTRLNPEDTASLTALNRRLAAWIEGEYHHTPHRGLDGLTPLEQWAQTAEGVRFPEPTLDLTTCSCLRSSARSRRTAR
jgi:putative transposase